MKFTTILRIVTVILGTPLVLFGIATGQPTLVFGNLFLIGMGFFAAHQADKAQDEINNGKSE